MLAADQTAPTELSSADTPATTIMTGTATQPRPLMAVPISTRPRRRRPRRRRPATPSSGRDRSGRPSWRAARPPPRVSRDQVPGSQADGHGTAIASTAWPIWTHGTGPATRLGELGEPLRDLRRPARSSRRPHASIRQAPGSCLRSRPRTRILSHAASTHAPLVAAHGRSDERWASGVPWPGARAAALSRHQDPLTTTMALSCPFLIPAGGQSDYQPAGPWPGCQPEPGGYTSAMGILASVRRATSTTLPERMRAWMSSVTSQHLRSCPR